jgi:hypothetical protein
VQSQGKGNECLHVYYPHDAERGGQYFGRRTIIQRISHPVVFLSTSLTIIVVIALVFEVAMATSVSGGAAPPSPIMQTIPAIADIPTCRHAHPLPPAGCVSRCSIKAIVDVLCAQR